MRPILSILTAAAFLLHVWLGCCAHHAHAAAEKDCCSHGAAEAQHEHDGHEHSGAESPCEESSDEDSSCPAKACTDGECAFLKTAKLEVTGPALAALLPVSVGDTFAVHLSTSIAAIDSGGNAAPAVRLHLAHQVFLN